MSGEDKTFKGIIMQKKEENGCKPSGLLALFTALALIGLVSGCTVFTLERVAAIHRTVATALEIAYTSGGKELVFSQIDELVADGKITGEQAADLKNAAQRGYDAFLAKLRELSEPAE